MLKDNKIKSIAAQGQKMAAVNSEGSLFMFGKVSKKVADSESGVVTSLLGTHVTQVDLGQLHTAVITDAGKVLTFGQNRYGQCGRNYVPIPEEGEQEEEGEFKLHVQLFTFLSGICEPQVCPAYDTSHNIKLTLHDSCASKRCRLVGFRSVHVIS